MRRPEDLTPLEAGCAVALAEAGMFLQEYRAGKDVDPRIGEEAARKCFQALRDLGVPYVTLKGPALGILERRSHDVE